MPLTGIEPATTRLRRPLLYPLSYGGMNVNPESILNSCYWLREIKNRKMIRIRSLNHVRADDGNRTRIYSLEGCETDHCPTSAGNMVAEESEPCSGVQFHSLGNETYHIPFCLKLQTRRVVVLIHGTTDRFSKSLSSSPVQSAVEYASMSHLMSPRFP